MELTNNLKKRFCKNYNIPIHKVDPSVIKLLKSKGIIDKIINGDYKDVIDICKVIAEVRTFMPQEIKEKMSKPQPEMYLRMMNDDYENA